LDIPGFKPSGSKGFFSLVQKSRPAVGPIQSLFNGYWVSFPGVKWPELEVNHSPYFHLYLENSLLQYAFIQ